MKSRQINRKCQRNQVALFKGQDMGNKILSLDSSLLEYIMIKKIEECNFKGLGQRIKWRMKQKPSSGYWRRRQGPTFLGKGKKKNASKNSQTNIKWLHCSSEARF